MHDRRQMAQNCKCYNVMAINLFAEQQKPPQPKQIQANYFVKTCFNNF